MVKAVLFYCIPRTTILWDGDWPKRNMEIVLKSSQVQPLTITLHCISGRHSVTSSYVSIMVWVKESEHKFTLWLSNKHLHPCLVHFIHPSSTYMCIHKHTQTYNYHDAKCCMSKATYSMWNKKIEDLGEYKVEKKSRNNVKAMKYAQHPCPFSILLLLFF